MQKMTKYIFFFTVLFVSCLPLVSYADEAMSNTPAAESEQGSAVVLQAFTDNDEAAKSEIVQIEDETKRLVMFVLGVPLLLLIIATVVLGVAMGVYGKPVFIPHMVCAGLSLTLALGHAVVGIVWFYPF